MDQEKRRSGEDRRKLEENSSHEGRTGEDRRSVNQERDRTVDEDEEEEINQAQAIILTIKGLLQRTNYEFPTFTPEELEEIKSLINQAKEDNTKLEILVRVSRVSTDIASIMVGLAAKYGKYFV